MLAETARKGERKTLDNEVKVSVIIPVYNAQRYLNECFDSIQGQTLREIEIICVDDGSTDDSYKTLLRRQENDNRIKVLKQENAGPGIARNTGFHVAKGEYVIFWDADDFFNPKALEEMYQKVKDDQADICVCGGYTYYEDEGKSYPSSAYLNKTKIPEEIPFNIKTNSDHICDFTSVTVWNKLFRREFIKEIGLEFLPLHTSEDVNYVINAVCRAESITIVDRKLITYRAFHQGSLSYDMAKKAGDLVYSFAVTAEELIRDNIFPERSFANRALSAVLTSLVRIGTNIGEYKVVYQMLQEDGLEKMHILRKPEGYYFDPMRDRCVEQLYSLTAEEFALFYLHEQTVHLRVQSGKNRELQQGKKQLRDKLQKELERKKELQKEIEALQKKNKQLKESWEYKIGRLITFIPKKIKLLWDKHISY